LQPVRELDMSWLDAECRRFIKRKAREYSLSGSEAVKVFRKRASVSAFRVTTLCYYLYHLELGAKKPETEQPETAEFSIRKRCVKIYRYMSEYIIQGLLSRWGEKFNELNAKRSSQSVSQKPKLYDLCTDIFTRDQLRLLIKQQGLTTPARTFICLWKKLHLIVEQDKNTFKKL